LSVDTDRGFFNPDPYVIDPGTAGSAANNDEVRIYGCLKGPTVIDEHTISGKYLELDLVDRGRANSDPILRRAEGPIRNAEIASLTGMSGSPVFNVTRKRLCGVVVRAGIRGGTAQVWYVDFGDILHRMSAIAEGRSSYAYDLSFPIEEKRKVRVPIFKLPRDD
jgi:hypothetical protein